MSTRQVPFPTEDGKPRNKIRVTVEDPLTGDVVIKEIEDDYLVVTAGSYYLDKTQVFGTGTVQLTLRRRRS